MSDPLERLAGPAAIVSGATLATHALLHQILVGPSADLASVGLTGTWMALGVLELAGLAGLLLSLPGLHHAHAPRAGTWGTAGFVLCTLGTMLLAGFVFMNVFVVPAAAAVAPALLSGEPAPTIGLGMLLAFVPLVLGFILFGIAAARAKVLPRAASFALVGGALLNAVPVVGFLGIVVVSLAWAWMGAALWRRDPAARSATAATT